MKITTVLFDLDGTLLPMDQDEFVKAYFGLLAKKLAPHGYDPKKLISGIWAGTKEMIKNNGECTNEAVFWKEFSRAFGDRVLCDMPLFEEFYKNEFSGAKAVCGCNEDAAKTVAYVKSRGFRTALATNPIFPKIATLSRIRWAGLEPSDFELITTYENSRFSKPNPLYYADIAKTLGVSCEECLMVGNDVSEDMAAQSLGMKVFLLTDCIINRENADIDVYPHGGFNELSEYIDTLLREENN
ncbi:MAG: HAD family hydrolase [Clostridia bacterium]|nr:HAD family hydrolase [Clostridia bacterium]